MARSFTFRGMARLATRQKNPGFLVLHDAEYGARIEGDRLIWHNRYNDSRPHTNSAADVFVVDCFEVGRAR